MAEGKHTPDRGLRIQIDTMTQLSAAREKQFARVCAERDRLKEISAEQLAALVMTKSWLESEPLWNAVTTQPGCETFGKRIVTAISRATVTP